MSKISLCEPTIEGNEWKYIKDCLDTGWVSSAGKYVELFESKIAEYTGSNYAIACVNGTSALQVSLLLAGVSMKDEVIIPTLTFIAPVNAIAYNNAKPIFMDVDENYNIDIDKTVDFIKTKTIYKNGFTYNKETKNKISAIIPVHVWGNAVYLDDLTNICKKRNIKIIEDASESLGTFYKSGKNKSKHTGTIGSFGCLSFNGNKIITTGGGGMILTDDFDKAEYARYITTQAKDDPVRYKHNNIGYNFRLTNIQAALGVAQLEQLPNFINKKRNIYKDYIKAVEKVLGLNIANVPSYANNNHWMNILLINFDIFGKNVEDLMILFNRKKIQTRPVWALNHLQNPYKNCQSYHITKAIELVDHSLCLPSSSSLTNSQINKVVDILNE
jgi:perosamine synthetase